MAINATDIYLRSGNSGAFTEITYVQGGWITLPSASNMIALDPSRVKEGQVVYVQHTNGLYIGSFFEAFVTPGYSGFSNSQSFAPFTWPGSGGGGGGSTDTGSLLTSASVSNNDITFTKGDSTTFTITVDTGSTAPGGSVTNSTFNSFTSSLYTFTSSIQSEVDALKSVTSSYASTGSNLFTNNQTIDGLLILTTQSSEPTYISGGLYLDSNYNLYIGGS
jgi:hypothetical protein